jgi:hypothetical protein
MAFKIGTLSVSVVPDDGTFEDQLREQVKQAAAGIDAKVGLRLDDAGVISLNEDVLAATDLATQDVKAHVGLGLKGDAVEALDAEVKAGVDTVEQDAKVKVSVDPKSAKDTADGISSMMIAGIAAGAAFAPAAILAAASVATVGLGALVVKSNADIQAEYQRLASDVGSTLTSATAPLVPAVEASLVKVDQAVTQVTPTVKALFADAEPDLYQFTTGVTGLAENFLPRFTTAVDQSRQIVDDFSAGLPSLGTGAGDFFTGLTTDSTSTGAALEDLEKTLGTTLGTAGQLLGSFSGAVSADLQAVLPVVDGVVSAIGKLANPLTVGGAAGALAVKQWSSGIQSGLQSASDAVLNFSAKADGAGGILGKLAPAGEKASGALSSMADVMGGPWGIAVGAGVGLLSGLAASFEQSKVSASDFTAAIAQDSGEVGSNTESIIQQTLAKQNLSDLNQSLGVSTSTLIAYAAGDKTAQQEVTAAYNAKMKAEMQAEQTQQQHTAITKAGQAATEHQSAALYAAKQRLDAVTGAVASAIKSQNDQTASLLAAEKATKVFNQQVDAEKLALQSAAQTALVNATALNENISAQGRLSTAAINASVAYQQETNATSQYTSALTALYGVYGDTSAAQATFTTDLANLKGNITSGTNAVDLNTAAGAKNFTSFQQAASAAETYSEKLYQQTGSAQQAQKALQQAATEIDAAATAAGLSAKQVQQLNTELFGVPKVTDIKITADTAPAQSGLQTLLQKVNSSSGTITVYENSSGYVGTTQTPVKAHAAGGFAPYNEPAIFGEQGPEIGYPVQGGMQIIPADQTRQILAGASSGPGGSAGAPFGTQVHQHFYGSSLPTIEQRATMRRELASLAGM